MGSGEWRYALVRSYWNSQLRGGLCNQQGGPIRQPSFWILSVRPSVLPGLCDQPGGDIIIFVIRHRSPCTCTCMLSLRQTIRAGVCAQAGERSASAGKRQPWVVPGDKGLVLARQPTMCNCRRGTAGVWLQEDAFRTCIVGGALSASPQPLPRANNPGTQPKQACVGITPEPRTGDRLMPPR